MFFKDFGWQFKEIDQDWKIERLIYSISNFMQLTMFLKKWIFKLLSWNVLSMLLFSQYNGTFKTESSQMQVLGKLLDIAQKFCKVA